MMKRNKLKAELLFTKLNSVFAKRADRDKFAGFNLMKNLVSKSSKIEYSKGKLKCLYWSICGHSGSFDVSSGLFSSNLQC